MIQRKEKGEAGSGITLGYSTNVDKGGRLSEAAAVEALGDIDREAVTRGEAAGKWLEDMAKPTQGA